MGEQARGGRRRRGGGLEAEVASTEQMTVDKAWEKREREESRMWEADSHTHHTR